MGAGLDFKIDIAWPVGVFGNADRAATLRGSVVRAARREMQKIADTAAANTPFKTISESYRVQQDSSSDPITVDILNISETWIWAEAGAKAHLPPWGEGSRLAGWMEIVGIENNWWNRFHIAKKLAEHDQQGYHILQQAWDAGTPDVIDGVARAQGAWLATWGSVIVD